ncbi:MAG: two-component system regulatory protein YycI [Tepidibacter sp.]|jgi:regulatory protein YycI of two-component signal transduction system YycFG|uniref:two-component system regulatory protein YycI n=1 Tax=Tepidibacter sp. TaxID=2529387 RepID=UPI0025CC40DF|nr:two-component system regulatory protein YycI [Tepidibacter sp.]MCT4508231.1 two-component system regulatory protein YycI [Tepidibacter sp.]
MDWSKAKTILIIAFILTNIVLGYNLYINVFRDDNENIFSESSIDNLNKLLSTKNISINTQIPKDTPTISALSIKYEDLSKSDLDSIFKGNGSYKVDDKIIIYNGKSDINSLDIKECTSFTKRFLKKYKFNDDNYLKSTIKKPDHIEIIYTGKYKDYFLEESYMKFVFYENKDFLFERIWLVPIEEKKQKKRVMTSVEAIMSAYSHIPQDSVINEIKLGYYFESNNMDIEQGDIGPVWRLKVNNEYIYIKAFDL